MSGLRGAAGDYLSVRRALGFQLVGTGRLLAQFADFAETVGAEAITTDLALQWATLPVGCSLTWHAQRLGAVRGFARWLQAIDPATQVPPTDLLPARTRRTTPYLYSEADITALMGAAGRLCSPLAAATMQTFIGLVFATGLRRGEVLGLDRGDLDPDTGVLRVREAKFGKPRQLPLHVSTVAALTDYATAGTGCVPARIRRRCSCPAPATGSRPAPCRRPSGACCAARVSSTAPRDGGLASTTPGTRSR
jgi:integrase/recombinase XerD